MDFLYRLYAREPLLMVNVLVALALILVQETDVMPAFLSFMEEDNIEPFVAMALATALGRGRVYSPATVEEAQLAEEIEVGGDEA